MYEESLMAYWVETKGVWLHALHGLPWEDGDSSLPTPHDHTVGALTDVGWQTALSNGTANKENQHTAAVGFLFQLHYTIVSPGKIVYIMCMTK